MSPESLVGLQTLGDQEVQREVHKGDLIIDWFVELGSFSDKTSHEFSLI